MTSTTVQFAVAGALIAAWAWMLGRPLLANLLRRSRRDSISHFRYQQAVLGSHDGRLPGRRWSWEDRPAPIATWRAQPLDSKRLQLLMASAISAFVALLLAIALRGLFVRLLMLMGVLLVAHLGFAAYVGSVRLKEFEAQARLRRAERERAMADELARLERAAADELELAAPEVRFPPLVIEPIDEPMPAVTRDRVVSTRPEPASEPRIDPGEPDTVEEREIAPEPVEQPAVATGSDPERRSILGSDNQPDAVSEPTPDPVPGPAPGAEPGPDHEASPEDERLAAAFKAAPESRRRSSRPPKARPIYIESQMDEPEDDQKAVND